MKDMLIAAPLSLEALLVKSGAPRARVRRTGMGPRRAARAAPALAAQGGSALIVMGFCGALVEDSRPGELVVANELRGPQGERFTCAYAEALTCELRRRGLAARCGPLRSVRRPARGETRRELARGGAIAVDMESVWLAAGAGGRPLLVVRAVVDTATRELMRPWLTVSGGLRAAASLRAAAVALHEWAPGV
jgi:4-hydroxy-3-methylbut-2-en-1-yl diphosphate reductase